MRRFFLGSNRIAGKSITISEHKLVHHLKDVLRFKPERVVEIFDAQANVYLCLIKEILKDKLILEIKDRHRQLNEGQGDKKIKLSVGCAIPKQSKMDEIVDKLTQLGVDRIIPLETERLIVKWDREKKISHYRRWQKIAISASQQSQRPSLPILERIKDMKEILSASDKFDLKLILTLMGERRWLKEVLNSTPAPARNILLLIGPEGDFSPDELKQAKQVNFIPITLGDLVLRVDTAAIAIVSYIRLNENS